MGVHYVRRDRGNLPEAPTMVGHLPLYFRASFLIRSPRESPLQATPQMLQLHTHAHRGLHLATGGRIPVSTAPRETI